MKYMLVFLLVLAGCGRMSVEEYAVRSEYCIKHGMSVRVSSYERNTRTVGDVTCVDSNGYVFPSKKTEDQK